ncbi:MAG: glutamate N-acetyltransferase/amino-acid acetyltransferase [Pseudomonadota bacterium]
MVSAGEVSTDVEALLPVAGVQIGVASAGIKPGSARTDLVMIELAEGSELAGVFTRNAFCAAPVVLARQHLALGDVRYLLVNSGNANAGTGDRGMADALACCQQLAMLAGGQAHQVLPFSTGVIGEYLPMDRLLAGLPAVMESRQLNAWPVAARGIMTTDTRPKGVSMRLTVDGVPVVITGIAKGSGMIHPDMATMLGFVATDAAIAREDLQPLLDELVADSFNCITVDGDTSTNDACVLAATGRSGAPLLGRDSAGWPVFVSALQQVFNRLAEAIVRDGEGATKFMVIQVDEARGREEARQVGMTVAHSPLVKTAFFASDPNWGRILAAVGRAGCDDLDLNGIHIWLGDVQIVEQGQRCQRYTEAQGQAVMDQPEITVRIVLGRGQASCRVMTCDFSYEYVRINAEYRS